MRVEQISVSRVKRTPDHKGGWERNSGNAVNVGWQEFDRTHGVVIHIDVKDDMVWVQRDNTNLNVVRAILEQGIPKDRIVLGFHAPFKRQFDEYATGNEVRAVV
jgi:hypothetical protein